jgi:ATP-binding cassette subfamily C protein CydC
LERDKKGVEWMMAICFSFLCWFSSTALMALAGYLIARAAEQPEMAALSLGVVGVRFFGLSRGAFRYVDRLFSHSLAFEELKKFRLHLYKILEPLVPYKLAGVSEAEILSRISADAEEYKSWLPRAGVPLFAGTASLLVSIGSLAYLNLLYALCFFAASFLLIASSALAFFLIRKKVKEWKNSSEALSEFSLSIAQGMAEKKSWGIFGKVSETWEKLGNIDEEKRKKTYSIYCFAEIFSAVSPFLCLAGMFFIGAGEFSFPTWIGILLGTIAAFEMLQEFPFIALQSALSLEAKQRICRNSYSMSKVPCLANFSTQELTLDKGDALVINAPSGAGKTLLANSIAGFLPNSEATVTANFVFLEQEPFLFTGTIKDNLLFASPDATDEEMQNALQKAGMLNFSFDLWVGERGFALSGGERQRLSAARAMLCNADLIIADEPSAHLPNDDEKKLFSEFVNLPNNPAVLWLSHFSILLAMSSFSAKILPLLFVLSAFLFSCSRESSEPLWSPQSHLGSRTYNGGLFPVWITLKEPVSDISSIRWKTGNSLIAYRSQAAQAIDANTQLIFADTAFLYWDMPPPPYIIVDSANGANDTTYFYRDTISAIVNGLESLPIVIEIKNILPRIKKLTVGGLDQPGDSILTIAAHPNAHMEISIHLEKPFNNAVHPIVAMQMNGLRSKSQDDTLWVYEWTVPDKVSTDTLSLQIKDSRGYGERRYEVRLIVYMEFGSVWIASADELVKFSSMGTEVARINSGFKYISDIAVNSDNGRLFVTDEEGNSIRIYDTYGKLLYEDSTSFKSPTGVAVGVEGGYVWVADAKDETTKIPETQLRRFKFSGTELGPDVVSYQMSGYVKGLSVDQYKRDFVWFAIPESDAVGFTRYSNVETDPKYIVSSELTWKRPSTINYENGLAWIADSGRVVAIDSSKKIYAIIKGFDAVNSISACGEDVWVSDKGKVYHFKGPFKGTPADLKYTVLDGKESREKFTSPVSINALTTDCSVWVVDKEAGRAALLDNLGNIKVFGTGLTRPILSKTLQK